MPRGQAAEVGNTHTAKNGYHYTRTEDGWRLTHHLIAEKTLGRRIDTTAETVRFKDKDCHNLHPDNILVVPKGHKSNGSKRAQLEVRIAELQAQLEALED